MKTLHDWLDTYGTFHQNPTNILIHEICVPLIMFSVLGLLWVIPLPTPLISHVKVDGISLVNGASIIFILALLYYLRLSFKMAVGMCVISLIMLSILFLLEKMHYSILMLSVVIFILSWIGQFIGHKIEGRKPAFLTDLQFLLIGPAWILARLYKKIGLSY